MAVKNARFESFLKRTLEHRAHEVKIYDPCVVLSKYEKHTFRYLYLTSDAICVTENPPKSVIFEIPLRTVKSIDLINDAATFLQKELQNSVQHVVVRHNLLRGRTGVITNSTKPENSHRPSKNQSSVVKSVLNLITKKKSDNFGSNSSMDSMNSSVYLNTNNNSNASDVDLRSSDRMLRSSSQGSSSTSSSDDLGTQETHFYVLNESSTIYQMLRVVWKSYLLKSTHDMEPGEIHRTSTISPRETIKVLFSSLKDDLISAFRQNQPIETMHKYLYELCYVAKENDIIQHLFWKDNQLFVLCVQTLERFSTKKTENKDDKADEIECMVLVAEIIALMLHQTEGMPACHKVLQACSGSLYTCLVGSLLHESLFPKAQLLMIDVELLEEYQTAVTDVIYQLIEITSQVSWNWAEPTIPVLTSQKLFTELEKQRGLVLFTDHVVSQCVKLWEGCDTSSTSQCSQRSTNSLTYDEPISGGDVVKLYRMLYTLQQMMLHCKSIAQYALKFKEEFRYYIRTDGIESKIPSHYPASNIIREVLESVKSSVLRDSSRTKEK